jgi:predicted secreted protein
MKLTKPVQNGASQLISSVGLDRESPGLSDENATAVPLVVTVMVPVKGIGSPHRKNERDEGRRRHWECVRSGS